MKAIIIDDEPLAAEVIRDYLMDYPEIEVVSVCADGFEGAKAISEYQPDLVFLDVQMPKITGFEMLEIVDNPPPVIFTTAYDQYALKAFESAAIDYLLKPISKDRFDKALIKFKERAGEMRNEASEAVSKLGSLASPNRIVIRDGGRIRILPVENIIVLEADGDYVKIKTADGTFAKKQTMAHYENILPGDLFIRVHRSYMVNLGHITRIEPFEKHSHIALLRDGNKIPVSKSGYQLLKEVLNL